MRSPFHALLLGLLLSGNTAGQTGENLDSLCTGAIHVRFWSIGGGTIREWSVVGNTVVGGAEILQGPAGVGAGALAFCDAAAPSTFHTGATGNIIYAYDDGQWAIDPVVDQPVNMGGAGPHLYFTTGFGLLYHYDGTTAELIDDPTPLAFACADIAVDPSGLAYLLVGPDYMTTSMIRAYGPDGTIAAEYPLAFDSFNTYGSFWANNTLYVALGTMNSSAPNTLFPITFNGGNASLGSGIPFPAEGLGDLASCVSTASIGLEEPNLDTRLELFPDPVREQLNLRLRNARMLSWRVLDATGREVRDVVRSVEHVVDVRALPPGLYHIQVVTDQGTLARSFLKE